MKRKINDPPQWLRISLLLLLCLGIGAQIIFVNLYLASISEKFQEVETNAERIEQNTKAIEKLM